MSEVQSQMPEAQRKYLLIILAGLVVGGIFVFIGSALTFPKYDLEFRLSFIITGSVILLGTVIVVVVQLYCPKICQSSPFTPERSAPPVLDLIESRTLRHIILGAGVLVTGIFVWAGAFAFLKVDESEIVLPVIIIAGVTTLLLVLGLLTFAFSVLKLSDNKEALGLPSGSVRAVIALMLLVIFAIVAIFLYSDVSMGGRLQRIKGQSDAEVVELRKQLDIVAVTPEMEPVVVPATTVGVGSEAKTVPATTKQQKTGFSTVYYRSASRAAEDLAKQLIVLLGTLVTAVSAFYFGSSSIAAATKQPTNTGGPNAKAVKNGNLNAGGDPQTLTIAGTNLGNVVGVKLTFEKEEPILADASTIVASDTNVSCKITTSTKSKYGPWTLVVSDNANNDSRVPEAVTIGTKPEPAVAPPEPKLIDQTNLKANATHTIKISGSNLASVEKVRFDPDTGVTVSIVKPVTPGEVTCTVTIAAASGERQIFVANKDGKEVAVPTKVLIEP